MSHTRPLVLSLSGGGLSSIAYFGFVEELKRQGIEPDRLGGLSGGAIAAVLLACGANGELAIRFFDSLLSIRMLNTHLAHFEIADHQRLTEHMRSLLPFSKFEDLPVPVKVFVTDIERKSPVVIDSGDLASAIVASCSVFPMLQPARINGHSFTDGGFTTYYGAQYLRDDATDVVVGIDVKGVTEGTMVGFLRGFYNQLNAAITSNARRELEEWPVDLDVQIDYPSPSIFSFDSKAQRLLKLGRRAAIKQLPVIRKLLTD